MPLRFPQVRAPYLATPHVPRNDSEWFIHFVDFALQFAGTRIHDDGGDKDCLSQGTLWPVRLAAEVSSTKMSCDRAMPLFSLHGVKVLARYRVGEPAANHSYPAVSRVYQRIG